MAGTKAVLEAGKLRSSLQRLGTQPERRNADTQERRARALVGWEAKKDLGEKDPLCLADEVFDVRFRDPDQVRESDPDFGPRRRARRKTRFGAFRRAAKEPPERSLRDPGDPGAPAGHPTGGRVGLEHEVLRKPSADWPARRRSAVQCRLDLSRERDAQALCDLFRPGLGRFAPER